MASAANANVNAVRETMDVLLEISRLLNTGLDMESLSICVRLCEQGINPEALSAVIKELRKASESLKASENCTNWKWKQITSVWDLLMGSCPIPGSVPTMGSPGNQICLYFDTLSSMPPQWLMCSCSVLWLVSRFLCRGTNLRPLSERWTSPETRTRSAILPETYVCPKFFLTQFVMCWFRFALTSRLNLRADFWFLIINLCCSFHDEMFLWWFEMSDLLSIVSFYISVSVILFCHSRFSCDVTIKDGKL